MTEFMFLAGLLYGSIMQLVWINAVSYRYAEMLTPKWFALTIIGMLPVCGSWLLIVYCIWLFT